MPTLDEFAHTTSIGALSAAFAKLRGPVPVKYCGSLDTYPLDIDASLRWPGLLVGPKFQEVLKARNGDCAPECVAIAKIPQQKLLRELKRYRWEMLGDRLVALSVELAPKTEREGYKSIFVIDSGRSIERRIKYFAEDALPYRDGDPRAFFFSLSFRVRPDAESGKTSVLVGTNHLERSLRGQGFAMETLRLLKKAIETRHGESTFSANLIHPVADKHRFMQKWSGES